MKKRGWGTILGASQGRAQRFDNIFLPHEFRGFLLVLYIVTEMLKIPIIYFFQNQNSRLITIYNYL